MGVFTDSFVSLLRAKQSARWRLVGIHGGSQLRLYVSFFTVLRTSQYFCSLAVYVGAVHSAPALTAYSHMNSVLRTMALFLFVIPVIIFAIIFRSLLIL